MVIITVMKRTAPEQLGFTIEDGRMTIPPNLTDQPYGKELTVVLSKNRLFKERPKKGSVLLIDLTGDHSNSTIYNPGNWQAIDKKPETFINPNYAAVIIVASQLIFPEQFKQLIEDNKNKLNIDGGEIFVFETGLSLPKEEIQKIRDERIEVLKTFDLKVGKEISIIQRQEEQKEIVTALLTQGRLKKIGEHHPHEVDLLVPRDDDSPGKQKWRERIIPKIVKMYQTAGFTEIDTSEIEKLLRHSKNPPRDLRRAYDGFGVTAKAPCGWAIQVDLKGNVFVLNHCPDHPNDIPYEENLRSKSKKQNETLKYTVGDRETKKVCFDCGANLIQSVRIIETDQNGKTSILVENRCPHCGIVSLEKKIVPQSRIIKPKTSE